MTAPSSQGARILLAFVQKHFGATKVGSFNAFNDSQGFKVDLSKLKTLKEQNETELRAQGGRGSGNFHHSGRPGERGGSIGTGSESTRAERAALSYKPSTAAKQRKAEASEQYVAKIVGGKGTANNSPMDVTLKVGRTTHGIEVKTLLDNGNDKITMHPASRERKEAWAKDNKATIHTVVVDRRTSATKMYYRRGVGSFRVNAMIPVSSKSHLNELMK